MQSRLPFITADPIFDRAVGMVWGAACGARVGEQPASSWPTCDDILVHLAASLIEHKRLAIDDVFRRLIRAWAQRAGRPAVVSAVGPTTQASTAAFVAGLAPICILRRTDRKAAQAEAAELAMQFGAGAAGGEALELMTIFLRFAVLGEGRALALAPLHWEGEDRVAHVAGGRSLPIEPKRDLVAAVDQARALALRQVSLTTAFTALASINAGQDAFILTGALIGALDGRQAFISDPGIDRTGTPSARMEQLVGELMSLHRHPVLKAGGTPACPS
ncbi:MAG: hypothetical protein EON96_04885 [Caulobacteraceae bacterium]|nr:MAG: hypothetical protein EON96_04885 [Caulobacteraceae bacterium]